MEDEPTRRPGSFFVARDTFDTSLYHGELDLTTAENYTFRFLLANALYVDPDYGRVSRNVIGVDTIARMTSASEKTVRLALKGLETKGMIRRAARPKVSGGRNPDDIEVLWLEEGKPKR